jgi:hypothetical protein
MQHNHSWSWTRRTFMKSSLAGLLLLAGKLLDPPAARSEAVRNCQPASERDVFQKSAALPSCLPWQEASVSRRSRLGYQLCPGSISPDTRGIGIQQSGI